MCLTPWISSAVLVIEIAIAIWLLQRAKTKATKIAVAIVVLLAIYQISEIGLCLTSNHQAWNLLGYLAVTWLPALGLHLSAAQTNKKVPIALGYSIAAVLSIGMLFTPLFLPQGQCDPLFVSYFNHPLGYSFYSAYYLGIIALVLFLLLSHRHQCKKKNRQKDNILLIGILSFIIPAFVVKYTVPFLYASFPSVFCFFAVFFAMSLVLREKA